MEALLAMMKAQMEQQTRSQAAMMQMMQTLATKKSPPACQAPETPVVLGKKPQKVTPSPRRSPTIAKKTLRHVVRHVLLK